MQIETHHINSDSPEQTSENLTEYPFVSVIIPCFNAQEFIGACLDSVVANNYPKDRLEILCIDGMSKDKTREIVKEYNRRYPWIKLVDNPKKEIPVALNIGIGVSQGDIILRMIAHCSYDKNYIAFSVRYLNEYRADNVGGKWIIVPRNNTTIGRAIALALSDPFGAGNGHYKTDTSAQPRWVDVAAIGCWKKEIFQKIGLFNEDLARNEDVEFNFRLRQGGGKTLLAPSIISYYHARSSLKEFTNHNMLNGFWITYPLKFVKNPFSWRHWIPFFFVSGLASLGLLSLFFPALVSIFFSILGLYACISLYSAARIAILQKDTKFLFCMPIVFASLHIPYGLGSLWGLLKVLPSKKFWTIQIGRSQHV